MVYKHRPYTAKVQSLARDIRALWTEIESLPTSDRKSFLRFCCDVWTHACNDDPEQVAGEYWSLCDADAINWLHLLAGGGGPAEHAIATAEGNNDD